jgi:hypothetical protein
MKTLIPPNITRGERKFVKQDGERHLKIGGQSVMCDMKYYPWIDLMDGDWKMIAAAPAMAEALIDLLDAHKDDKDDAWCRASHKAALEALLAAGYTIKD